MSLALFDELGTCSEAGKRTSAEYATMAEAGECAYSCNRCGDVILPTPPAAFGEVLSWGRVAEVLST